MVEEFYEYTMIAGVGDDCGGHVVLVRIVVPFLVGANHPSEGRGGEGGGVSGKGEVVLLYKRKDGRGGLSQD